MYNGQWLCLFELLFVFRGPSTITSCKIRQKVHTYIIDLPVMTVIIRNTSFPQIDLPPSQLGSYAPVSCVPKIILVYWKELLVFPALPPSLSSSCVPPLLSSPSLPPSLRQARYPDSVQHGTLPSPDELPILLLHLLFPFQTSTSRPSHWAVSSAPLYTYSSVHVTRAIYQTLHTSCVLTN